MTDSEPQSSPYLRLSDILNQFAPSERNAFVRAYREGVRTGAIKALPLNDTFAFNATSRRKDEHKTSQRQDEVILNDAAFQRWLEQTQHKLSNPQKGQGRSLAVSFDDLVSGQVINFEQRAAQYRKQLQPRAGKGKKTKRQNAAEPAA